VKIFLPIAIVTLCLSMIVFPKETFESASLGLTTWWTIVFPSLLPFFIIAELFLGLGVVHLITVLLEPVMRPIFNLPGSAAFVVAMGYTSGFPIGAALTASLRKKNLCTRREGERLVSFTNNASPLFIFVAVAVGLFHRPSLGITLALAHYGTNLLIGLCLRFVGRKDPEQIKEKTDNKNLLTRSLQAMLEAQKKDGRPFGKLLGDAVRKSIQSLTTVGGFIILFAVIIRILTLLGVTAVLIKIFAFILHPLGFSHSLFSALSSGLFEMTLGAKFASESSAPFFQQVVMASMIIAWGGFSIHAQVLSIISETDLRFYLFIISRIAHMALAGLFTFFLLRIQPAAAIHVPTVTTGMTTWYIIIPLLLGLFSLLALLCMVILFYLLRRTILVILKIKGY